MTFRVVACLFCLIALAGCIRVDRAKALQELKKKKAAKAAAGPDEGAGEPADVDLETRFDNLAGAIIDKQSVEDIANKGRHLDINKPADALRFKTIIEEMEAWLAKYPSMGMENWLANARDKGLLKKRFDDLARAIKCEDCQVFSAIDGYQSVMDIVNEGREISTFRMEGGRINIPNMEENALRFKEIIEELDKKNREEKDLLKKRFDDLTGAIIDKQSVEDSSESLRLINLNLEKPEAAFKLRFTKIIEELQKQADKEAQQSAAQA